MVCEGLFRLFGTSSEEVIARAKKESDDYYLPQIEELSSSNKALSSDNKMLSSDNKVLSAQIDYLKKLLTQNNIAFDLGAGIVTTTMSNP